MFVRFGRTHPRTPKNAPGRLRTIPERSGRPRTPRDAPGRPGTLRTPLDAPERPSAHRHRRGTQQRALPSGGSGLGGPRMPQTRTSRDALEGHRTHQNAFKRPQNASE
eukprot:3171213-Pyramimonas_sp.AAC.1